MSRKGSLVSGTDFDDIGRKGADKAGGGAGSQDRIKLGVAVALFLTAGIILGWYYGLVDTAEAPPPPTPDEIQYLNDLQAQQTADVEADRIPPPRAE